MSFRATDNLRHYLSTAQLPQMALGPGAPALPPHGHKSHRNRLSVTVDPHRQLRSAYKLQENAHHSNVRDVLERHLPKGGNLLAVPDADAKTGERLTVPAQNLLGIQPGNAMRRPDDVNQIARWIAQFPIATIQRVIHLCFPESQAWAFARGLSDVDADLFHCFEWRNLRSNSSGTDMVIAVQPPWVLSPQDLKSFTEIVSFPHDKSGNDSKYKLWFKMWDLCRRRNCHWFAISTYNEWVFGSFSPGWTTAFVTPVIEWNGQNPNVLESFAHWVLSAMKVPGAWTMPQIRETIGDLYGPHITPKSKSNSYDSFTDSESSWGGKSESAATSAGVGSTYSGSAASIRHPSSTWKPKRIQQWAVNTHPGLADSNLMGPTYTQEDITNWCRAGMTQEDVGEWVSLPLDPHAERFH